MKKVFRLISSLIIFAMVISFAPSVTFSADEVFSFYDDMEAYESSDLGFDSNTYCSFGANANEAEVSADYAYSGTKSIKFANRRSTGATLKCLDIFKRELNETDIGKTFRISFMIYPDKNAGVYKRSVNSFDEQQWKDYLYSADELEGMEGTRFSVVMTGPNGKNYTYRQNGGKDYTYYSYAKWNEWTEIYFYYTVNEGFLSNGSDKELSNPYINAFRIGQNELDDEGLAHTFYIDDLKVDEVGSEMKFSVYDNMISVKNGYNGKLDDYARTFILEYDTDNKLIGAFVGEKNKTNYINGMTFYDFSAYERKASDSSVYTVTYGGDCEKVISPKTKIYDRPEEYEFADEYKGRKRAKEMLELSKATYTDAYEVGLDVDNKYFFAAEDTYASVTNPDSNYFDKGVLEVNKDVLSYVKFDLSSFDKSSTSHAYLRFIATKVKTPGILNIYSADSSWNEESLTYASKPSYGEAVSSGSVENIQVEYVFDISSYINKVLKENKNELSFAITTEDANVSLASMDTNLKTYLPCLILEGVGMKEGEKKVSSYDRKNFVTVMKRDITPTDSFVPTPTRTIESLVDYKPVTTAPKVNKFGGWLDGGKYQATGFYHTELIDGRWWIIDPEGYKTIHIAIAEISPNVQTDIQKKGFEARYQANENWANTLPDELREYGFNGAGPWSDYKTMLTMAKEDTYPLAQVGFKSSFIAAYDNDYGKSGYGATDNMLSVFDPGFETKADSIAKSWIKPYADNPYVMGWYTDNEPIANNDMLFAYLCCDPNDEVTVYNYYTAWEWLKSRHGENAKLSDVTLKDKEDWVEFVYDRYMYVCTQAIRKYDKNHMILGPKHDKPHKGALRAMKNWVDAIGYDYYGNAWNGDLAQIDEWYRWAGKPFINAEWYAKGQDACTPETELTNEAGVGWEVTTQKERGDFYQGFVLNMIESKVFVGWQWFKYMDNDPSYPNNHYSNINANKGIITRDYKDWKVILSSMKEMNYNTYSLIEYFDRK